MKGEWFKLTPIERRSLQAAQVPVSALVGLPLPMGTNTLNLLGATRFAGPAALFPSRRRTRLRRARSKAGALDRRARRK
jgi:hypothetical protein